MKRTTSTPPCEPFREATGIDVQYEGLTDYELTLQTRVDGNDAPDLAQIAQPGKMISYASEGQLVDISPWFNVDKLSEEQVGGFVDLTEVRRRHLRRLLQDRRQVDCVVPGGCVSKQPVTRCPHPGMS